MTIPNFFHEQIQLMIVAILFAIGVILRLICSGGYHRLIRHAEDMGSTKHPFFKALKMKFHTSYELRLGVNNVDTFVDKYVYKYKIMGIYMYILENLCGQSYILILTVCVFFGILAVGYDCGKVVLLSTTLVGISACAMLILMDSFLCFSIKRQVLKVTIKDYLENIYKPRLEMEVFHTQERQQYQQEYFESEEEEQEGLQEEEQPRFAFTKEEQSIIEDVIKQYIV